MLTFLCLVLLYAHDKEKFMEQNTKDLVIYVLVRNDLPSMNPGKAMAQVHHLGVQIMSKFKDNPLVQEYVQLGQAQGADHFNTTLVLSANRCQIAEAHARVFMTNSDNLSHEVWDPSYPFFVENTEIADLIPETDQIRKVKILDDGRVLMTRPEITCAGFLGDRNDPEFRNVFAHLSLHE
jgi:hypothetical protein